MAAAPSRTPVSCVNPFNFAVSNPSILRESNSLYFLSANPSIEPPVSILFILPFDPKLCRALSICSYLFSIHHSLHRVIFSVNGRLPRRSAIRSIESLSSFYLFCQWSPSKTLECIKILILNQIYSLSHSLHRVSSLFLFYSANGRLPRRSNVSRF
jgi:hypothetical protein